MAQLFSLGALAMWKYITGAVVVVALYLFFGHAFTVGEIRRPRVIHVKNTLFEAYMDKTAGVIFTNRYPQNCRVFDYTNLFVIAGTNFQCVLAADSWDYQGASNLLALTSDKMFLYIDEHGAVLASHYPPGYDSFP